MELINPRLGKEPDTEIAAEFGVNNSTIRKLRAGKRIPPSRPYKLLNSSELSKIHPRLGGEYDSRIAADFGVNESTIRKLRVRQSIPSHQLHTARKVLTSSELEQINSHLGKELDNR